MKMKKGYYFFQLLLVLNASTLLAQLGIGTNTPDPSALLDLNSDTKGFLPPRMETSLRNLIASPVRGLMIYNTFYNMIEVYSGPPENPSWVGVQGAKGGVGFKGPRGPEWVETSIDLDMKNVAGNEGSSADGGNNNTAGGALSAVLGGKFNKATGVMSSVIGGYENQAIGQFSTIIGGNNNKAAGVGGTVIGGNYNLATGINSAVTGGNHNLAEVESAAVLGGYNNKSILADAVVSGGTDNTASGAQSCVLGGINNTASGTLTVVVGGANNGAIGTNSAVIGGQNNKANGTNSVILAGIGNTTLGTDTTIGGGTNATTIGDESTVSGGMGNTAFSYSEWVGGLYNSNYNALSTTAFENTDRLFTIGNGTSDLARSDAFIILKNGLASLPSTSTGLISDGSNNAIVTKEYINDKVLQFKTTAPTTEKDTGTVGEIRMTTGFIYFCIATDTWVRKANDSGW
jgi:hypothetical protein